MSTDRQYDVVVVGAGNAGLCAALSSAEEGASVLVLEKAPSYLRGGNTYFTGGLFRFAYDGLNDVLELIPEPTEEEKGSIDVGSYPEATYYSDLMRVTGERADRELAQLLVSQSFPTMMWLSEQGIRWILAYGRQAFKPGSVTRFWGGLIIEAVGGGKDLSDRQFELAEHAGASVLYEAQAAELLTDENGGVLGVKVRDAGGSRDVSARSVVLACGGFEANPAMRARHLGTEWETAKVRGTQYNTGDGIWMALDIGAQAHGDWGGCHAVAWDLNAPPHGDRKIADLFQKHSYQFGLIVNVEGQRFVDEGADFRNYTYVKYGREILHQTQQAAFQLFDRKTRHLLRDEYWIPQASVAEADTVEELADDLGIDRDGLSRTVTEYNDAVQEGEFDPTVLDGKCTKGIDPPKSNWALPLDRPPYLGYAVTCGITFTFGGLKINARAEVMDTSGKPIPGLYATGELVGGLFYDNYPGGAGLMAGAVFGRIAGASAARRAIGGR